MKIQNNEWHGISTCLNAFANNVRVFNLGWGSGWEKTGTSEIPFAGDSGGTIEIELEGWTRGTVVARIYLNGVIQKELVEQFPNRSKVKIRYILPVRWTLFLTCWSLLLTGTLWLCPRNSLMTYTCPVWASSLGEKVCIQRRQRDFSRNRQVQNSSVLLESDACSKQVV